MAKKKRAKYNKGCLLMAIVVIILAIAIYFLIGSSVFNVSEITVKGNVNVSSEEIISLSGIDYETNILKVDEETAKENIEKNFFVIVDNIRRTFLTGVEISVHERVPAAQIGTINGYYIIDSKGVTMGLNQTEVDGLVKILNLGIAEPQGGQVIRSDSEEKLEGMFLVLEAMEKYNLNGKILGVDMNDPQRILLTYTDNIKIQIANGFTADDRLKNLEATVEAVKDKLSDGQIINMESAGGYYIG